MKLRKGMYSVRLKQLKPSDLYSPVSGEVLEFNEELEDAPELVNKDPYGKGWIIKISISDASELDGLLTAAEYEASI